MTTVIYWTEAGSPKSAEFSGDSSLTEALAFSEKLRAARRSGLPVKFITSVTEDPNNVGQLGVADPPADYDWKKRR